MYDACSRAAPTITATGCERTYAKPSKRREDVIAMSALTGLAPGTVRGFINGRPSSVNNVLLMAEAVGYTLAEARPAPSRIPPVRRGKG